MPSAASAEIAQLLDSIFGPAAPQDERPERGTAARSCSTALLVPAAARRHLSELTAGSDRIAEAIRYMNRHLFEPI